MADMWKKSWFISVFTGVLVLLGTLSTYISFIAALNFPVTGFTALLMLTAFAGIIAVLIYSGLKRCWMNLSICGLGAIILILAVYGSSTTFSRLDKETREKGDRIVQAVSAYHTKVGKLPTSLNQLVPEYFTKLPEPSFKNSRFDYRAGRGEFFTIAYFAPDWMICQRQPRSDWRCDD